MQHHIHHHTQPAQLEKYSFLWSEARLIIAAFALFLGGVPPLRYFLGGQMSYGFINLVLTLSWLISGVASAYMLYRWNENGRMLFGKKQSNDLYAFLVSVVSGLNLGLVAILGRNIGMGISSSYLVFVIVGVVYIISAMHLHRCWKENGGKIF